MKLVRKAFLIVAGIASITLEELYRAMQEASRAVEKQAGKTQVKKSSKQGN